MKAKLIKKNAPPAPQPKPTAKKVAKLGPAGTPRERFDALFVKKGDA